jgi:hypothetical protein
VRFLRLPKTGAKSVFQIENLISKPRGPRKNRRGHRKNENPVLRRPTLCAKGSAAFPERNQGHFRRFSALLDWLKSAEETECFIEHPLQEHFY